MNTYYNPVRTYLGFGCLSELPHLIREAERPGSRILLLVWDKSVIQLAELQALLCMEENSRFVIRCLPCSNPELQQLYTVYMETRTMDIGLVVAIGGGSILDVGKSLCCLYGKDLSSVEELRKLITANNYGAPSCRWIGVPTTAGTGSEVTCWATIWDSSNNLKYSMDTVRNFAYAAVVDPQLVCTMPLGLKVSTALDAVTHAAESYWAKASNPVSKSLALTAARTIMGHIDILLGDGKSQEVQTFMAEGSMIAGLAFSNTHTTACHSISYPLTMRYRIPHGVAVSLLLGPVMELNAAAVPELDMLLWALGVDSPASLHKRICATLRQAGLQTNLRGWGAAEADIPALVSHSITRGRADNNPVELNGMIVHNILSSIL